MYNAFEHFLFVNSKKLYQVYRQLRRVLFLMIMTFMMSFVT